ncbi:hypothetical protein [Echinimonas agarilytica]|uniref:Flagellar basal-body/hook protein C-terminal domain-containing protein n=1 Tax=Echinimonas agarilytica TaxID=1215918 RepID=A0AA42B8G6_9GAMM|nr:hypothetical protein [Echinimonas agarilytica]MCM2680904.1 hypothetical protein [Echinimonas agarilytica]
MNSIGQSGLYAVNQAQFTAATSAQTIASSIVEPAQAESSAVTEALVNLTLAEVQSQAGAKLIKTADEMVGTLIDVTV